MMTRLLTTIPLLLALLLVPAACGEGGTTDGGASSGDPAPAGEAPADGGGQRGYRVQLEPLNGSGATGTARLSLLGSTLRVQAQGEGFAPGEPHPMQIRRLESGEPGTCPTEAADADGDGIVSEEEAASEYGAVGLDLTPEPSADQGGALSFQGTSDVEQSLLPLEDRVLVVQGLDRDGEYDPSVPVACGEIENITPG